MTAALFLSSPLLAAAGVRHGFSLRAGGVSAAPFDTLNLSRAVGDEAEAVAENLRRLSRAAGLDGADSLATVKQVHGDRVLLAGAGGVFDELFAPSEPEARAVSGETRVALSGAAGASASPPGAAPEQEADALISATPGLAAAVRVADCTPILLWAPSLRAAGAVHSGWRGARLGIAGRGAQALIARGASANELVAAVGPCIGRCCYVVSRELAASFRVLFGAAVADDPDATATPHLDLRACAA